MHNERYKIHNEYYEEDSKTIQVVYSENSDVHTGNNKTNVILAAFVTCYARLKLYEALDFLGERVLYFDTDSIFYVSQFYMPDLTVGDYLGQFTDELDKEDGNYIKEFVTTGPKSYAFETDTGVQHCTRFQMNAFK